MAITVPTSEPTVLYAGDFWTWTKSLADYPASLWTMTYRLLGPTVYDSGASLPVTADGDDYLIEVTAAKTGPLSAGEYQLVGILTEDGTSKVTTFYDRPVRINPNAETLATSTNQTQAEAQYAAVDALLDGRLPKDMENFQINGRAITRIPYEELRLLRGKLAVRIRVERNPNGLPGPSVAVRF